MFVFVKGRNDIKQFNILHMKFETCNSLVLTCTIRYCLKLIGVCYVYMSVYRPLVWIG